MRILLKDLKRLPTDMEVLKQGTDAFCRIEDDPDIQHCSVCAKKANPLWGGVLRKEMTRFRRVYENYETEQAAAGEK